MKTKQIINLIFIAFFFYGCHQEQKKHLKQTTTASKPVVEAVKPVDTSTFQKSVDYLKDTFKDDLAKDLIDSLSRTYLVSETDLNKDGKPEMFIGLQGPYFCGSGGCTVILLDSFGKLITRFTVTEIPIRLGEDRTKDWIDLILNSRGKQYLMKFDGSKYPSNPSVEPEITLNESEDEVLVLDGNKSGTLKATF